MPDLYLSSNRETLHDGSRNFDPWKLSWSTASLKNSNDVPLSKVEAVEWLYKEAKGRQVPVGVIGPREATEHQEVTAEQLGKRMGELRIPLLNGGKNGVMEAVSKGCCQAGGLVLGFVPDDNWEAANDYVTVPIATGIGKARNVLIAQSCQALVAVGGGFGTHSEMAFGMHFEKPGFAMAGAPEIDGVRRMEDVEDVIAALASVILKLSD